MAPEKQFAANRRNAAKSTGPKTAQGKQVARTSALKHGLRAEPVVIPKDERRCRMHGGAEGSGAPKGNKKALKNGFDTREALEERRRLRKLMADARKMLKELV